MGDFVSPKKGVWILLGTGDLSSIFIYNRKCICLRKSVCVCDKGDRA